MRPWPGRVPSWAATGVPSVPPSPLRRALLVTSVLPWPLQRNGGAQRTALLRRALGELGFEVDLVGLIPADGGAIPDDPDTLRAAGVTAAFPVEYARHPAGPMGPAARLRDCAVGLPRRWASRYDVRPDLAAFVRRLVADRGPEVVIGRYLQPSAQCDLPAAAGGAAAAGGRPCLLDFDDVDWLALASQLRAEPWPGLAGGLAMRTVRRAVRRRSRRLAGRFDGAWTASDEDAAAVAGVVGRATTLPNVPFEPMSLPASHPASRTVLFVGDLQHRPNRTGLDRFVAHVWPLVRRRVPAARFRVVGRGLGEDQAARWGSALGVEVVGFAEDLRAEYESAAVSVVPAWWGGGTKIKVGEAAAAGRAQVATPAAVRGYGPLVGRAVRVAESDAEFAAAVAELLEDPAARAAMEVAGPEIAAERYSFEAFRGAVTMGLRRAGIEAEAVEAAGC